MLAHTESKKNKPTPGSFFSLQSRYCGRKLGKCKEGSARGRNRRPKSTPSPARCESAKDVVIHDQHSCDYAPVTIHANSGIETEMAQFELTDRRICEMLLTWPKKKETSFGYKQHFLWAGPATPAPGRILFQGTYQLSSHRPMMLYRRSSGTSASEHLATSAASLAHLSSYPIEQGPAVVRIS